MPERSRISPMKVKNGIARSVSFAITPKKRKANRDQGPGRPLHEAPRVRGAFAGGDPVDHVGPDEDDGDQAERQEEEDGADDINPNLRPAGEPPIDDVDLDVLAPLQGVSGADQEDRGEQVP